jgi:hypothetical protein
MSPVFSFAELITGLNHVNLNGKQHLILNQIQARSWGIFLALELANT